jgi:hypothetical protein
MSLAMLRSMRFSLHMSATNTEGARLGGGNLEGLAIWRRRRVMLASYAVVLAARTEYAERKSGSFSNSSLTWAMLVRVVHLSCRVETYNV